MSASSTVPFRYLSIEGNIGAGKTSLSQMLASHYDATLILEEFAENTFLDKFYRQPERYAFPLEVSFLTERFQQLKVMTSQASLFEQSFVSDYLFDKSLIFAQNTLQSDQYKLLRKLFETFHQQLPRPDLVLYLHSALPRLQRNIRKRGRPYEVNIKDDYLTAIQKSYLAYLKSISGQMPVIVLETTYIDFVGDRDGFHSILETLENAPDSGFHFQNI